MIEANDCSGTVGNSSQRVHSRMSSDGSFTSLILDKSTRADSGEYQLTLTSNDTDSDCQSETVTLLVNVIGEIHARMFRIYTFAVILGRDFTRFFYGFAHNCIISLNFIALH